MRCSKDQKSYTYPCVYKQFYCRCCDTSSPYFSFSLYAIYIYINTNLNHSKQTKTKKHILFAAKAQLSSYMSALCVARYLCGECVCVCVRACSKLKAIYHSSRSCVAPHTPIHWLSSSFSFCFKRMNLCVCFTRRMYTKFILEDIYNGIKDIQQTRITQALTKCGLNRS